MAKIKGTTNNYSPSTTKGKGKAKKKNNKRNSSKPYNRQGR